MSARRTFPREGREYWDLRSEKFNKGWPENLKAILNELKLTIKAIRFIEQKHLLGRFGKCSTFQAGELNH